MCIYHRCHRNVIVFVFVYILGWQISQAQKPKIQVQQLCSDSRCLHFRNEEEEKQKKK